MIRQLFESLKIRYIIRATATKINTDINLKILLEIKKNMSKVQFRFLLISEDKFSHLSAVCFRTWETRVC